MQMILKKTLLVLAGIWARAFGLRVILGGTRAYTDGRDIYVPNITELSLKDVVLGFIAHEASHIRNTNFQVLRGLDGLLFSMVNALEDLRIERCSVKEWPGTIKLLQAMWTYVITHLWQGGPEPDNMPRTLVFYVLLRIRQREWDLDVQRPLYEAYEACVRENLPEGFFVRLDVLFDKYLDTMSSTLDAVKLAKAIFAALKEAEEEANQTPPETSSDDCDSNDSGESDQQDGSDSGDSSSEGLSESSDDAESDSDADADDGGNAGSDADADDQGGDQGDGSDADTGSDDDGSGQSDTDAADDSSSDSSTGDQPQQSDSSDSGKGASSFSPISDACATADAEQTDLGDIVGQALGDQAQEENPDGTGWDSIVLDGGQDDSSGIRFVDAQTLSKGIQASGKLRAQIVDILQAESEATRTIRDYGSRFDTNRLGRALAGDTCVWRHDTQGETIDTSVHLLIDRSGSMGGIQHIANSAAVALALAIAAVPEADIAISAFPAGSVPVATLLKRGMPVRPSLDRLAVESSGGTPMVEAMAHAITELASSLNERKVVLIVTDGAPSAPDAVRKMVKMYAGQIDFYAIGIGTNAVEGLFKHTAVISDVSELQAQLFKMAKQFLTARR